MCVPVCVHVCLGQMWAGESKWKVRHHRACSCKVSGSPNPAGLREGHSGGDLNLPVKERLSLICTKLQFGQEVVWQGEEWCHLKTKPGNRFDTKSDPRHSLEATCLG